MDATARRMHVERLARAHDITLEIVTDERQCQAREGERTIATLDPSTELGYFVALHELGHLAGNNLYDGFLALFGVTPEMLDVEAEAWWWALDHALAPPSAETAGRCLSYFQSYALEVPTTTAAASRVQRLLLDRVKTPQ